MKLTTLTAIAAISLTLCLVGCVEPSPEIGSEGLQSAAPTEISESALTGLVCGGFIECCVDETCTAVVCKEGNVGGTQCTARCPVGYTRLMPKDGGASCTWEREKVPERENVETEVLTSGE